MVMDERRYRRKIKKNDLEKTLDLFKKDLKALQIV